MMQLFVIQYLVGSGLILDLMVISQLQQNVFASSSSLVDLVGAWMEASRKKILGWPWVFSIHHVYLYYITKH